MLSAVAVVGSGRSGLHASRMLAEAGIAVTLVERLPAAGGQDPEGIETDALARRARAAGVDVRLGTLAHCWEDGILQLLGVDGATSVFCDRLVIATGTRPATRAELGIAGDRCAGVLPGSAALHITESGVLLGHRPAIVGGGSLAASLVAALRHAGAEHVTVVAPDGVLDPAVRAADGVIEGWSVTSASGNPRVQAIALACADDERERIAADALLLAHRRVPMRNVEGAIAAAPGVVFCHSSADPKAAADAESAATRAVAEILTAEFTEET